YRNRNRHTARQNEFKYRRHSFSTNNDIGNRNHYENYPPNSPQQAQQAPPSTPLVAKIKDPTHKDAAQSSHSAEGESQNDSQNRKSSVSSIYVSPESPISETRDNDRSKDKLHSAGKAGN
ncbi:MAG: hypothetical protein MHMPM18_004840, partial [Marteilia pararefringens]